MPRKCISGFAEAGAAMAQQLDDNDLLNLFSAVGRVVSKRFLMKRQCLDRWQLVLDYLTSAIGFEPREQFRVLYLDKRNNLIADEVLAEGTVDHTPCIRGRYCDEPSNCTPPAAFSSTTTRPATQRHPGPIST
jgi:DNA repair protein RadC